MPLITTEILSLSTPSITVRNPISISLRESDSNPGLAILQNRPLFEPASSGVLLGINSGSSNCSGNFVLSLSSENTSSLDVKTTSTKGIHFFTQDAVGVVDHRLCIREDGRVGINQSNPKAVYWSNPDDSYPTKFHVVSQHKDTARFESTQDIARIRIGISDNSGCYIEAGSDMVKIGLTGREVISSLGYTNLYPCAVTITPEKIECSVPVLVPPIPTLPDHAASKAYVDSVDALGSVVVLYGHKQPNSLVGMLDSEVPSGWVVQVGGADCVHERPEEYSPHFTTSGLLRIVVPENTGTWSVSFTGVAGEWYEETKGAFGQCFVGNGTVSPGNSLIIGYGLNMLASWHATCIRTALGSVSSAVGGGSSSGGSSSGGSSGGGSSGGGY